MKLTFGDLDAPILYVWWRGDVALYVGMSMRGLWRLSHCHERLRGAITTDHLDVRFLPRRLTKEQVRERERALIVQLKPVLNQRARIPRTVPSRGTYQVLPRVP